MRSRFNSYTGVPFCARIDHSRDTVFRLSLPLPASFKRIHQTNNSVELTWSASASQVYQVQYRTDARTGEWTNLGGTITATNGTMTTVDSDVAGACRFYRIAVLP